MNARRISPITVLSIVLLQGSLSCIHPSSGLETSRDTRTLERIEVADLDDRIRIEVDGAQPLTYSLSTGIAPPSVTVELPGLAKGNGLKTMDINKAPVLQIVPHEVAEPRTGVQLVMQLTSSVKPDVHTEGSRLYIDFPKSPIASEQGPGGDGTQLIAQLEKRPESTSGEAVSLTTPAAKVMTKVEVQRGNGEATVIVSGDGDFTYEAKRLDKDRLIVDLANISSAITSSVLPVEHALLKQIRIGHHPKKVRLVFDLSHSAAYAVNSGRGQLAIRLTAQDNTQRTVSGASKVPPPDVSTETADKSQATVRVAASGRIPFPERLSMIQAKPALAQIAPEARGPVDAEEIGQPRFVGRRISLDFQAADISNVLRLIAEVSGFNIVVGEGVKSKVTLKLVGVPWDQALDMLLKMNNLGMIRESNIVWIDTLANIARQQEEEAKAKESKIKAEELITKVLYVQNVSATEIQTTIRQYLSPRGLLNVNAASNALVLQDTESRITSMADLIRSLDLEVPQVQIEARIVQADTSYARSLGVQWGISNTASAMKGAGTSFVGNQTGAFSEQQLDDNGTITRGFNVNLPAAVAGLATIPAAGFTFGKIGSRDGLTLDIRLSAGELLGLTKVIAAPKITTLDKREAKISQGEAIPFQTTSLQGTQTTFVDANLELQVTPQITSRDPKEIGKQVLLKLRATRNAVGARSNPAGPSIDKREANTQVLVRDGETMVIGGIFVDSQTNQVSGIPYLSRIPVLGWLFKNKTETIAKQELLIFLTPSIVKG